MTAPFAPPLGETTTRVLSENESVFVKRKSSLTYSRRLRATDFGDVVGFYILIFATIAPADLRRTVHGHSLSS